MCLELRFAVAMFSVCVLFFFFFLGGEGGDQIESMLTVGCGNLCQTLLKAFISIDSFDFEVKGSISRFLCARGVWLNVWLPGCADVDGAASPHSGGLLFAGPLSHRGGIEQGASGHSGKT